MRFTPMAVLIGFLSTAVTAGPFDGFSGGTGECDLTREEGISIFDNELVSVIADTICTMVRSTPIRYVEKTVLYDFESNAEGTVYNGGRRLLSITADFQLLPYTDNEASLYHRCK